MNDNNYYTYNPPGGQTPPVYYPYVPQQDTVRPAREKSALKVLSRKAGACVVAYVVIQLLVGILVSLPSISGLYLDNLAAAHIIDLLYYVVSLFVPFFVLYLTMPREERESVMRFDAPVSWAMVAPAVIIGLLMCTVGNYATNYLAYFLENFGIELSGGEYTVDTTPAGLIYSLLTVAVIPGFAEEFALRGVVMQPLRKYGDTFAVIMSSVVFSLMHGNMIQIPFAFIAGIGIGCLVISTGSIWTGVIIHILNNAYSVILNYLVEVRPPLADKVYAAANAVFIVFGIVSVCVYIVIKKQNSFSRGSSVLSTGQKTKDYIFTLPMLIAIAILIFQTAGYVNSVGT